MRILALDQSPSSTGFALWDEGAIVTGAWPLCEGIARRAIGFNEISSRLLDVHRAAPIDLIAYEQPIKRPSDKVEKLIALYGVAAMIEAFCQKRHIRCFVIGQHQWRESYFGKKHGIKGSEDLKRAAIVRGRQYGFDPITHDEAEAIAILDHQLLSMKIMPAWREANPFLPML
jgi:hypothetical protein